MAVRDAVKAALGADAKMGEIATETGRRWGALSAAEKAVYEKQAANDKARFESEGGKVSGKAAAAAGGAPKGAPSAYILFTMDKRASVKEEHPDLSNSEVVAKMGEMWRGLSDAQKKPYEAQAAKAKADAAAAKEAYEAEHGKKKAKK